MAKAKVNRRLAAILAADVVGYSRLVGADEEGTIARLKALREELIDPGIAAHDGRIVKTMGDGLLVEYPSVVDAVRNAAEFQQAMAEREAGTQNDRRITFRIGINLGDIVIDGDDILGDGVNVAARLEGLAEPGGICISGAVFEQVKGKVDIACRDIGERSLKNIEQPVRVYRIDPLAPAPAPAPKKVPSPLAPTAPEKPSIAVLPFDNLSGDPEQEYFSDGITEDIITDLSKFRWMFVIARNSTFAYKGQSLDIRKVAEQLGVRYVLEGSVRKAGNRVRITGQLIDAATGNHIWAERYDRELADVFDLQDEITRTIVATIEPELGTAERDRASRKPTESLTAWDLYQRGLWHRWKYAPEDLLEARRYLKQAVEIDDGFAAAHAHLAWIAYLEAMMGLTQDREATLAQGLADGRRAVALNDRDPLVHCALGFMLIVSGAYDEALQCFKRSVRLNENFAQAFYGLSVAHLFCEGDGVVESIEAASAAIRLSPNDPLMWGFLNIRSMAKLTLGEFEDALADATQSAARHNAMFWPFAGIAASLKCLGRDDAAEAAMEALFRKQPDVSAALMLRFTAPHASTKLARFYEALRSMGLPEE